MATRMQQRRGTASQWTTANPVLAAGEIGFETDTGKFKIGDGTNTWSLLKYFLNLDALDIDGDGFVTDAKVGVADGVASLDSDGLIPVNQLPDQHLTNKINTKIAEIVGAAPETLNTLNELAAAIDNNAEYADNITAALELKAPKESPTFTGTVTAPTPDGSDNSTKVATTQYVQGNLATISTNLGNVGDDVTTLQASVETINSSILSVQSDIESLQSNDGSISTSIDSLDARLDVAEASISSLDTSVSTLDSTTTTINSNVSVLQSDLETAVGRISATEADISTINTNVSDLSTDLSDAQSDISTIQANASALDANVEGIDTRLISAESDIDLLQTSATSASDHASSSTNVHGIANTADLATKSYADNAKTDAISTSATAIALKADIDSPALTGTPTAPTATAGTDTTQIATTAFVQDAIELVIGAAPAALDTLNELAAAINDDSSYAATVTSELALKAPKADPTFTGTVALPAASSVTLDGTALSVTLATKADNNSVINTMSGSHTISSADVNNIREMSGGGTISIPADNSFWPVGAVVDVIQTGSSQVTVAGGSGVTVNATPGLKLRTQWSSATILKRAANTFVVMGDLSA
jgi:predicted  nucleic acid-binding Zn-ribbon protein